MELTRWVDKAFSRLVVSVLSLEPLWSTGPWRYQRAQGSQDVAIIMDSRLMSQYQAVRLIVLRKSNLTLFNILLHLAGYLAVRWRHCTEITS